MYKYGEAFTRIPNIFNLSNKILDRVDPPKVKHEYVQQTSHEVDVDKDDDMFESDLFHHNDSEDNIRKTVHIECIDMDIIDSNDNLPSKRSKNNADSEQLSRSESESSSGIESSKISKTEHQVDQFDIDERTNKFKIKNFDLTQNFMKGRQCGRENTPSRKALNKKQRTNLSKIKKKFDFNQNIMKAWDEDESTANASHVDKVEIIEKPKITKISKIKTDLKKVKSSLKVVRVMSARRLKHDAKHAKKQVAIKRNNPFKISKDVSELSESNSGSIRSKKHKSKMPPLPISKAKSAPTSAKIYSIEDKILDFEKVFNKLIINNYFKCWKSSINHAPKARSSKSKTNFFSSHKVSQKHKKKGSENVRKPFPLFSVNSSDQTTKDEEHKRGFLFDEQNVIKEANENEDEITTVQKLKHALSEQNQSEAENKVEKADPNIEHSEHENISRSKDTKSTNDNVFEVSDKKAKSKDAYRRYQEISNMLGKLQQDASRLSQEFKRNKQSDP